MKIVYITLIVLISGCTIFSKGVSYFGEEKFFTKQFNGYTTYKRETKDREPGWELGLSFLPHKNGRINGIWLKNPSLGNVPVCIWDVTSQQLLQTFQFKITDTVNYNHFILSQPFNIIAQKKYCISINVTKYYYHTFSFNGLPIEYNNCTLLNSVYEEAYYQRYPHNEINSLIHGLIDVDMAWQQ